MKMPSNNSIKLCTFLLISSLILLHIYSSIPSPSPSEQFSPSQSKPHKNSRFSSIYNHCNLFKGHWVFDPNHKSLYDESCPFHRNAWNCLKNKREKMGTINSWKWEPENCSLNQIDPFRFLGIMRNKNIGFVGDSLNENFLVSFLCVLRVADIGAKKWKKKGSWRGAYFPKYNVTVAYHRAVLLVKYQWQPKQSDQDGLKGIYRVDVDIPADDWVQITKFYDVLVFNTGHWWGPHKFPKEKPLVFYQNGKPILPALDFFDGLRIVLKNMISYIEKEVPSTTIKFWRLQSPRHFFGGEWNQNGSCLFDEPLQDTQLDLWFDPVNNGVNKEARELNQEIEKALQGSDIQILELSHLSEYRADAHPGIWLGKKDAVSIWGQDCMHWCLPGVPDTWVDILSELIRYNFED
ncbi:protein trichome birefringence-like 12 [Amaranthus tricolor]|uniref:protein trichome birefringence-like 12 n=1 Tax=Amaranthus tricolor TaxID=29722 RepID=UPI0025893C3C|nr:protein trichome birefringence-like 12 [Amaranthus tricolor]